MSAEQQLLIPVYLNQRVVFDLVAMLQGGISTVTRVSETNLEQSNTEREVGAAFGLSNAFASLLKINLSGSRRQANGEEAGRTSEEERVHTPASLFFVLRKLLVEKQLLVVDGTKIPEPGDFVEFSASLRRNPVIEVVDALHQMMKLATIFSPPEQGKLPKPHKGHKPDESKTQLKQIEEFRDTLRTGDTIDLTTAPLKSGHRAVLTVETQYLNDPSMGDLVDGTFAVVGKVTRVLADGEGSVSLIRKTALERMPPAVLEQSFASLNSLSADQGFGLPELQWQIPGPVIQILPVAIYA
jgi:hypothetical protein